MVGVAATIISFAGSWIPSFWGDEAASIVSAERSIPSLGIMLANVDAVHGTYYLFLHFWIELFGASPLSVRLPSALAAGFAAAGTYYLATQLFSRRIGIVAGIVCSVLPRMTYQGAEARTYAFATAAVVWLSVLFVHLVDHKVQHRWAWFGYAAGLAASLYLFLFSIPIVLSHGIYLLVSRSSRETSRRWVRSLLTGLLLAAPVIVLGAIERHQIAFLQRRERITPQLVIVEQWFGNEWLAIVCWSLIVVACVVAWMTRRHSTAAMLLLVSWLILPTVLILGTSVSVVMIYTNRYLSFCAPAAAILIGVGIDAITRRWMRVSVLILIVSLAFPTWYAQRTEFGKPGGSDWAAASAKIASLASPGDAVVFDESVKPSWRPRLAMQVYPDDYRGLVDVALETRWDQTPGLWDTVYPLATVAPRLVGIPVVWALETSKTVETAPDSDLNVLQRDGYRIVQRIRIHRTIIYQLSRSGS